MSNEAFTDAEVEVIGEALDAYVQAKRYAGALSDASERAPLYAQARVGDRLLERVAVEEANREECARS